MLNLITNNLNINKTNTVKQSQNPFFGLNASGLQPLQKDTVSFSGAAKFEGDGMAYAPSEKTAKQAHINAKPAQHYLQTVFDLYLAPSMDDKKSKKKNQTVEYHTRIKSPNSIREKVASKVMKYYSDDIKTLSEQITDSFSEKFGLSENVKKEDAQAHIQNTISMHSAPVASASPYTDVSTFVDAAFDVSEKYNLFSIDNFSEKQQNKILSKIVKTIKESEPALNAKERAKYSPSEIDGIKHYAYDIVGGKIIFNEDDDDYARKIVDGLKAAVEDNVLKIKSIENNVPDESRLPKGERVSQYAYIPESKLKELAEVSGAKLVTKPSKAGYMSVHINVDLTSDLLKRENGKYNGYGGEIQITGKDVNKLKKTEDLCYKFKDQKNVYHEAYKPFKDHFLKYYKGSVKKHFDDYTYALYLNQRKAKNPSPQQLSIVEQAKFGTDCLTTFRQNSFPTIEELGFGELVPPELDFNLLSYLKEKCDSKKEAMDSENGSKTEKTQNQFVEEGKITGINNYISYELKKNVTKS